MISIIVPTHNRRALLEKKLLALEGQGEGFEVVVVADGCTDDTPAFLKGYQPTYPLVVLHTQGKGAAHARNQGAAQASGDILLFSDDDVIPAAGFVRAHQEAHISDSSTPVVAVGRLLLPRPLKGLGAAELPGPRVFWWNATGNNTSLPKALFEAVGGYDPERFGGYGGEDPDLGYRLKKAGARFVFVPEAQAIHEAWDHTHNPMHKARQAGEAHMRVYHKHKDAAIAWALGVHPALLALKLATLPWLKGLLGSRGDYELAYAWGAWSARYTRHD